MKRKNVKVKFNDKDKEILAELPELCYCVGKKKLCGSARRRYLYHRKHEKTVEKAYDLACLPMSDTLNPGQLRSQDRINSQLSRKTKENTKQPQWMKRLALQEAKFDKTEEATSSTSVFNRDISSKKQIGIINIEHPYSMLSSEQLNDIQKIIVEAIPLAAKDGVNPQFEGVTVKSGWLLITCLNEITFNWLEQLATTIQLENTKIKAVREENIPKLQVVTGNFPGDEDSSENILTFLNSQNPTFNASNWKILKKDRKDNSTKISFSIDTQSMENLKLAGFRACYKFSNIILQSEAIKCDSG